MADFVFNPFRDDIDSMLAGASHLGSPTDSNLSDDLSGPDSSNGNPESDVDDERLSHLMVSAVRAQSMPSLEDRLARHLIPAPNSLSSQSPPFQPAVGGKQAETISHVASFWNDPPPVAAELDKKNAEQTLAKTEAKLRAALLSLRQANYENGAMRYKLRSLGQNDYAVVSSYDSTDTLSSSFPSPVLLTPTYVSSPDEDQAPYAVVPSVNDVMSLVETPPHGRFQPPLAFVHSVLNGAVDFEDLNPRNYRAIVWVIAHCQSSNAVEHGNIKTAAFALTNALTYCAGSPSMDLLISYIIELGVPLCKTASGNYLCQVMLETATPPDRREFILNIQSEIIQIAGHRFGCHVLNKAVEMDDLQELILQQLKKVGIPYSMRTGARRVWRAYTEISRKKKETIAFDLISEHMAGHWVQTAVANEHGSISCQQVFEVFPTEQMMASPFEKSFLSLMNEKPCYEEIIKSIHIVANSVFGHFVITKILTLPVFAVDTTTAILQARPPVATSPHGISFVRSSLAQRGRAGVSVYVDALCRYEDGESAGLVDVASCSSGPPHLNSVLNMATQDEKALIRATCKAFTVNLRMTQSGNDFLRLLGFLPPAGLPMGPRRGRLR